MANYRQSRYAVLKGVARSRIGQLLKAGKLITVQEGGELRVVDCPANDAQFNRPAHNRKIK